MGVSDTMRSANGFDASTGPERTVRITVKSSSGYMLRCVYGCLRTGRCGTEENDGTRV